ILAKLECGSRNAGEHVGVARLVRQQSLKLLQCQVPHPGAKQQVSCDLLSWYVLRAGVIGERDDLSLRLIHRIVVQQVLAKLFANPPAHGNWISVPYTVNRGVVVAKGFRHGLRPGMRGNPSQLEIDWPLPGESESKIIRYA